MKYTTPHGTNFTTDDFLSESIQSLNFMAASRHTVGPISVSVSNPLVDVEPYNLQTKLNDAISSTSSLLWTPDTTFVGNTSLHFKLVSTTQFGQRKLTEMASVSASDPVRVLFAHLPPIMKFYTPDGATSMMITANGHMFVPAISNYLQTQHESMIVSDSSVSELLSYNVESMMKRDNTTSTT